MLTAQIHVMLANVLEIATESVHDGAVLGLGKAPDAFHARRTRDAQN